MTSLRIADPIFDAFPDLLLGVVVARGVANEGERPAVTARLRGEEAWVRERLAGTPVAEHPQVVPWRDAYRRFGARPKDHLSSVENLLRRVLKGHELPAIGPLVDLYNAVSLAHVVPVGGEDLDRIEGDLVLAFAGADEPAVRLLGEAEPRPPNPGEVIYKDDAGAVCRRWNWKEADRTKLTEATTRAVLVVEGLPPVGREEMVRAVGDLAAGIREHCGGQVETALLDRERRAHRLAH